MSSNSPQVYSLPCGGTISTAFVFNTVDTQAAANSVYVAKSTIDGQYAASNAAAPRKYVFKTDAERMQFILGRQALTRPL